MGRFTPQQKYDAAASCEELQELDIGSASETTATEHEGYAARGPRRRPVKVASIVTAGLALVAVLGLAMAGRGATARNGSPDSSLELLSVCPEHPTEKLTSVCGCGITPDCAADKFCYGRRVSGTAQCEDHALPCSVSTTKAITLDCMCDTTACTLTQYCYGSPKTCHAEPECVESTTTKNSDPYCKCAGTTLDATKPYCYDGGAHAEAKSCATHFSTPLTENCKCGSTSPCAKGRYCYGHPDAATSPECNAEGKSCPESTVDAIQSTHGPCKCGTDASCAVGKYCYNDMCESGPMECPQSSHTKLAEICRCGATLQCQKGNYCYSNQCEREQEGTVVKTSFTLTGIDYAKLEESQNLLSDFQVATRDAIAKTATHGITKDNVEVTLSAGSVKVEAEIIPPPGISAASVESSLVAAGSSLGSNVVNEIDEVANIGTVKTGAVAVSDLVTPFMVEPAVASEAAPTPLEATPAPPATNAEGQSIEDLMWWAEHGSKFGGEEFKQKAEDAQQALAALKS